MKDLAKEFIEWLNEHVDPLNDDELSQPKALDILLDAEDRYFWAVQKLNKKHRSLETVEQIDKFTKEIEKLCK